MLCPVDGTSVLVMTERQGIEIDYCPTCRGVWLDRGELDKIIERAAADAGPAPAPTPPPAAAPGYPPPAQGPPPGWPPPDVRTAPAKAWGSKPGYGYDGHKKKKKGAFLSDLFDL